MIKNLFTAIMIMFSGVAYAWEPPKTVTVIVGNQPGAGNEIAFRKLASIVNKEHPNVTFVMQHMPGADQVIALNYLMTQPNNGSVLASPSKMNFVTNDIWQKKGKKFQWDSFSYITSIGDSALVLVAHKNSKINTPQEFMARISNTKEQIVVAIGGGAHRTALEYLIYNAKADKDLVKHLNYSGPSQALDSVMKNETEFGIMPIAIAQGQIEYGSVKAIGFTGNATLPQFPKVPLLNVVAPGIDVQAGWLLIAPPKTPEEIVNWYNAAFVKAINSAEFNEWQDKNIVTIAIEDLTPSGMRDKLSKIRQTFLPLLNEIITNEGEQ
jgi:tripartite-type tricarboxylate transporter receptor subunit TctC